MAHNDPSITVGLNAVILSADTTRPQVLIVPRSGDVALPFGSFDPDTHRTFEIGLRRFVSDQAHFQLGYVEQLYTFGDRDREMPTAEISGAGNSRIISISYLALTSDTAEPPEGGGQWRDCYQFFPWEDWRSGRPACLDDIIIPHLINWAEQDASPAGKTARSDRIKLCFGCDNANWNEERVLDRYELLFEAGLGKGPGLTMASDHRRILATALSRLRGKIKYRPVVFDLMPDTFTLSQLQQVVEGIVGYTLHKQNFRRALDRTGFVEGTGKMESQTGGRPAELFRYRRKAQSGGPASGLATPRL